MTGRSPLLDAFTIGYLEAAEWTTNPKPSSGEYQPDPRRWSRDAVTCAVRDCAAFQADARLLLAIAYQQSSRYDAARAGQDFFLTRNGHGCGFWDRDTLQAEALPVCAGTIGEALSAIAKRYGETYHDWYRGRLTDSTPARGTVRP